MSHRSFLVDHVGANGLRRAALIPNVSAAATCFSIKRWLTLPLRIHSGSVVEFVDDSELQRGLFLSADSKRRLFRAFCDRIVQWK
jgi:hypothetical protein